MSESDATDLDTARADIAELRRVRDVLVSTINEALEALERPGEINTDWLRARWAPLARLALTVGKDGS